MNQFIEKPTCSLLRLIGIIERLFSDISIFIKPIDEGLPASTDNLDRRVMNMAVDKAWQN